MARKRRGAKANANTNLAQHKAVNGAQQHGPDPSVACIALHPQGDFVAVAGGNAVRISDRKDSDLQGSHALQQGQTPVRAIAFDSSGKLFLSAGDDKLVKIWRTGSWELLQTACCPKKITAAIFSSDSKLIICADKFGDVFTTPIHSGSNASAQSDSAGPAQFLLGHLSSIVTSLTLSPDAKHLVSTDQDCKVRVSVMPSEPAKAELLRDPMSLQGAHSIQSICMGHEHFAKCSAFLPPADSKAEANTGILVSGGGDGTIRSWDYMSGKQLDCCRLAEATHPEAQDEVIQVGVTGDGAVEPAPAAALAQSHAAKHAVGDQSDAEMETSCPCERNGAEADADADSAVSTAKAADEGADAEGADSEDGADGEAEEERRPRGRQGSQPAVLSVSAAPGGGRLAAAVEGQDSIAILHCSPSGQLRKEQSLSLTGVFLPTQVQFDGVNQLWAVGGPLLGSDSAICLGVATHSDQQNQYVDNAEVLPDAAREALQGQSQQGEALRPSPAAPQQVNEQLRKRIYSFEERQARKKNRNDIKL